MALVLVVEDDPVVLKLLVTVAEDLDHEVKQASSVAEALELLEPPPRLVVSDICMPDMTGVELVMEMRRNADLADTPVLFVTAHPDRSVPLQATGVGAMRVLEKPFHVEEMAAAIREALADPQAGESAWADDEKTNV